MVTGVSSRGVIVALVTTRTVVAAFLGAALGAIAGIVLASGYDAIPPRSFVEAVVVLALLTATLSAIPPSIYAAVRDPVRVLRTP